MDNLHPGLLKFVEFAKDMGWSYTIHRKPDPNCKICGGRGWNESRFSQYEQGQTVDCSCVIVARG